MQYFIGLTFSGQYLQYKKIDIYRRRFDHKYTKSNILQLTLLPPFEFDQIDSDSVEALEDEIDGHLNGHKSLNQIKFNGIDFNSERKGSIFLRPELPLELQYCQQSLWEAINEFGGSFKKKKAPTISMNDAPDRAFLPIGRTRGAEQFEEAVLTAKLEFENPFSLKANGIALFESTPGQWLLKKQLFIFENEVLGFNEMECFEGQIQALYV